MMDENWKKFGISDSSLGLAALTSSLPLGKSLSSLSLSFYTDKMRDNWSVRFPSRADIL